MTQKSIHAYVTGKVQRVYYRASLQREAIRLGLTGFVRNLPDGRVEFFATGPDKEVDDLLNWSHNGPPMAQVSGVETVTADGDAAPETAATYTEFVVLR